MRVVVTTLSDSDEDDNVSYFGANFRTSSNHIMFNGLDVIKRLALIFSLCEQNFMEKIIIFENLCKPILEQCSISIPPENVRKPLVF